MNIETLQIKRILTTDAWTKYKDDYTPKAGELVWVKKGILDKEVLKPGCVFIGDGVSTLDALKNSDAVLVPLTSVGYMASAYSVNAGDSIEEIVAASTASEDVNVSGEAISVPVQQSTSSLGTGTGFARSDHEHCITRDTVWDALDVDTEAISTDETNGIFTCRRIMCGKGTPGANPRVQKLQKLNSSKDPKVRNLGLFYGDIYIQLED